MNVAYTERYQAWREKYRDVFTTLCLNTDRSENHIKQLENGYTVRSRFYEKETDDLCICASEHDLLDSKGQVIYTWRNMNDDAEFYNLVRHANGRNYLVFRCDLYGYSVLEIETLRDFHFIPYEAYPANGDEFQETFIFTGVKYNSADNMLAVSGCYWACPSSVILLDFTNPQKEQDCESWIDIHKIIDADYDIYEDIEFERWGSEDFTLHVTAYNIVTNRKDSLTINLKEESMKSNIERQVKY